MLTRPGDPDAIAERLAAIPAPGLTYSNGAPIPEPDVKLGPEDTAELLGGPPRYVFTSEYGIYRTEWPMLGVTIDYDQLHRERSGDLTAECSVKVGGAHIHTARVTLTGTRSRQELAKHVKARALDARALDWDGAVEVSSVRAVEAHRAGEPAILMRDAPQPMDDGYLMFPLAHARLPVIIFGDGGSGKSQIALAIGASIHSGQAYMGLPTVGTRTVGYLDWEMSAWEHRQRLRALCGESMPGIVYVPMSAPLPESVDRLKRVARERGIGYWIVDSIAPACGGEPESAEVASSFFNALRALGGASLSIAHVTKGGEGADMKPFGSTFWHNLARATWYAKGDEDGDSLTVGLYHRKNNTGRKESPIAVRIDFEGASTIMQRVDLAGVPTLAAKLSIADRAEALMRSGAKTILEIADELESSPESVGRTLRRLRGKRFMVFRGPSGIDVWGLQA